MIVHPGVADLTTYVLLRDAVTGWGATGVDPANIVLAFVRDRAARQWDQAIALGSVSSPHMDWGVKEVDATYMPGLYRVDWPDEAFAAGTQRVHLCVTAATPQVVIPAYQTVELDPHAAPHELHVAKTGAATNDGRSWRTPKLTIGGAKAVASEGATIFVAPGSYDERVDLGSLSDIALRGFGFGTVLASSGADGQCLKTGRRTTLADLRIESATEQDAVYCVSGALSYRDSLRLSNVRLAARHPLTVNAYRHLFVSADGVELIGTEYGLYLTASGTADYPHLSTIVRGSHVLTRDWDTCVTSAIKAFGGPQVLVVDASSLVSYVDVTNPEGDPPNYPATVYSTGQAYGMIHASAVCAWSQSGGVARAVWAVGGVPALLDCQLVAYASSDAYAIVAATGITVQVAGAAYDPAAVSGDGSVIAAPPTHYLDAAVSSRSTPAQITAAQAAIVGADGDSLKTLSDEIAVVDGVADAIKLRTDRIGSATVTITSPVTADQDFEIFSGDDYLDADGGALTWTVSDYSGPDLAGAEIVLEAVSMADYQDRSTATAAISADGSVAIDGSTLTISVDLASADTASLQGEYHYQIRATTAGESAVTLISGTLTIVRDVGDLGEGEGE